ncbi:MAG: YjiH family protein, partial [Candidatus Aminicenantes bacterium]|nr:YjiH family protein [Candidatus Aminicenantes bacterium]
DGLILAALILSTIASVGTIALLLAKNTQVFNYLAVPFYPIYKFLGMPQPMNVSIATVLEIAEMYLPTIAVKDSPIFVKFYIAVLSTSQLIFFSSVGPMIIDMFREIPVKFSHLLVLFIERTLILIPMVWSYTYLVYKLGFFG